MYNEVIVADEAACGTTGADDRLLAALVGCVTLVKERRAAFVRQGNVSAAKAARRPVSARCSHDTYRILSENTDWTPITNSMAAVAVLGGYRCSIHPVDGMANDIVIVDSGGLGGSKDRDLTIYVPPDGFDAIANDTYICLRTSGLTIADATTATQAIVQRYSLIGEPIPSAP